VLPGRRNTFEGIWGESPVVVKRLNPSLRAWYDFRKEIRVTAALRGLGIAVPEVLYAGRKRDGSWVLVMRKVGKGNTLAAEIRACEAESDKDELLRFFLGGLAYHHAQGVEQRDLHGENYIQHAGELWLLDAGQVRLHSHSLSVKKSLSQLALVLSQHPELNQEQCLGLIRSYFSERGYYENSRRTALVQKYMEQHRHRNLKKFVRKCLRNNSRHLRIRDSGGTAIVDRDFAPAVVSDTLWQDIEQYMEEGTPLKEGNTSVLVRARIGERDVLIKRYNHKGFFHSIRQTLKGSRAQRSWCNAHRLRSLGVSTPFPLAMLECLQMGVVHHSYILTEYVHAHPLGVFLENDSVSEERRALVSQRVLNLFENLKRYKVNHNDLKHTNILVHQYHPLLTDLDGMRMYRSDTMFRRRWRKDWERFLKNWEGMPAIRSMFE